MNNVTGRIYFAHDIMTKLITDTGRHRKILLRAGKAIASFFSCKHHHRQFPEHIGRVWPHFVAQGLDQVHLVPYWWNYDQARQVLLFSSDKLHRWPRKLCPFRRLWGVCGLIWQP